MRKISSNYVCFSESPNFIISVFPATRKTYSYSAGLTELKSGLPVIVCKDLILSSELCMEFHLKFGLFEKYTNFEKIFLMALTNQLIYLVNVRGAPSKRGAQRQDLRAYSVA